MFAIEFRNGSYFQSLTAAAGGPLSTAQKFKTKADATALMDANEWIYLNGGMVVKVEWRRVGRDGAA